MHSDLDKQLLQVIEIGLWKRVLRCQRGGFQGQALGSLSLTGLFHFLNPLQLPQHFGKAATQMVLKNDESVHYKPLEMKIWVTNTKAYDEAKDLSWSVFLVVDFTKVTQGMTRVMSFLVDEENKRVMCWKKGFGDLTTFIIVVKFRPVLVVNMVHFTLGQRLHYFGELLNKISCLLTDCKITSGYHSILLMQQQFYQEAFLYQKKKR